jgi:putative ABC transport system ATP-binding protein
VIRARGLQKSYRDGEAREVTVLGGLDLDVAAGEFVAVVGPSGSGKSTLLHILGGLDVQYGGTVEVAGTPVTGLRDRALSRFRNHAVGFVFQSFHLVPNLDALENVYLPAFFGDHAPAAAERARARDALARVGLTTKADRKPAELSGGERQRVAIARALFTGPKVLFCDEPTGNLDAATGSDIIGLFQQLHRDGLTVLAVTHEERISQAAQRVLRLHEGKLVAPREAT